MSSTHLAQSLYVFSIVQFYHLNVFQNWIAYTCSQVLVFAATTALFVYQFWDIAFWLAPKYFSTDFDWNIRDCWGN